MLYKFFRQTTRLTVETAAIAGIAYSASSLFSSIRTNKLTDPKQPINKDAQEKNPTPPSITPFYTQNNQ
jgi:hypothetical protein